MTDERPALDLSTHVARELASNNHSPAESWDFTTYGSRFNPRVVCEQCEQVWPCATRTKLLTTDYCPPLVSISAEVLKTFIKLYDAVNNEEIFPFEEEMQPVIEPHRAQLKRMVGM